MDFTYGEEVSLDAVAPLFANSKPSKPSSSSTPSALSTASSSSHHQAAASSTPSTSYNNTALANDDNDDAEEMEEGELLEEGEISEESSDESESIAATLIAPAYNPRKRKFDLLLSSSSLPPVTFPPPASPPRPHNDLSLRIAPSTPSIIPSSSPALPFAFPTTSQLPTRPQPVPPSTTSSSSSSILKPAAPLLKPTVSTTVTDNDTIDSGTTLQEYEKLIDELYSYGVTCDYLLGRGVTKDLVIGTFAQKGYKLPEHHLIRHRERQQQWHEHQAGLVAQQQVSTSSASLSRPQQPQERPPSPPPHAIPERKPLDPPQAKKLPQEPPKQQEVKQTTVPVPSSSMPVTSTLPPTLPPPRSIPSSDPTLHLKKKHHRAVSSLGDASLIRMGALMTPPLSSAPMPTSLPAKRRRVSQDTTSAHSSNLPMSIPPRPTIATPASTSTAADKLTSDLQALKEELARKEAAAKEALRARKAALAKQNAQRAENFIEGLLSASSNVEVVAQPVTAASSAPARTLSQELNNAASTSQDASSNSEELEDYEEGEEGEVTPPPVVVSAPTASALSPASRPFQPRQSSYSTLATQASRSNRPVATDFEADPSHSLPNVPRWTEQLLECQRRSSAGMLIDLSDSEGDDDDDDEKEDNVEDYDTMHNELRQAVRDSKMKDAVASSSSGYSGYYQNEHNSYSSYSHHRGLKASDQIRASLVPVNAATTPTATSRRNISPTATTSRGSTPQVSTYRSANLTSTSTPTSSEPVSNAKDGKAELEAKQAEIRKMLIMIKKMESSKKSKKLKETQEESNVATTATAMKRSESTASTMITSREASAVPPFVKGIDGTDNVAETIHAAKQKVGQLLDEQEQLLSIATTSSAIEADQVGQQHRPDAVVSPAGDQPTPPSASTTTSQVASSSDEAMSISSEDE